jgi:hypothetical protein
MNSDLINLYIEQLLTEITEGVKNRVLLETRLKYTEILNSQLQKKIVELEEKIEKINKKKIKEVNTSSEF